MEGETSGPGALRRAWRFLTRTCTGLIMVGIVSLVLLSYVSPGLSFGAIRQGQDWLVSVEGGWIEYRRSGLMFDFVTADLLRDIAATETQTQRLIIGNGLDFYVLSAHSGDAKRSDYAWTCIFNDKRVEVCLSLWVVLPCMALVGFAMLQLGKAILAWYRDGGFARRRASGDS